MSGSLKLYRNPETIKPPHDGQIKVIKACLSTPYDGKLRKINLSSGWGFGKTITGIDVAQLLLQMGLSGIFLEPNANLMESLFLASWQKIIPKHLYSIKRGNVRIIKWLSTGAELHYGHRSVTGRTEHTEWKFQGHTFSFLIDDEASTGTSLKVQNNLRARIREPKSDLRLRLTLSTPRLGDYETLINEPGSTIIYGSTEDNPYLDKKLVADMRSNLTPSQAARDMDGQLIASEGRIWKGADLDNQWPNGNIDYMHPEFDSKLPWYLFSDLGSATGADVVVQKVVGSGLNPRWVIVAEQCPDLDATLRRRYRRLRENFGVPTAICGGRDFNTKNAVSGDTPAYFATKVFGSTRIIPVDETSFSRQIQYDCLDYLFINNLLTVAKSVVDKNPKAVLENSNRGVVEMIRQDCWLPVEERRKDELLPKNKKIRVQHIRDALLAGSIAVMKPPTWLGDIDRERLYNG